jgi:ribosomal 50S subunit-associated protein YjgA (DUF615 family)
MRFKHSNRTGQIATGSELDMTSVRDEVSQVLHTLHDKRARLLAEMREVDRVIALIDFLNNDNHKLRTFIQSSNRRQRDETAPPSRRFKRASSPTFSEGVEDGEL